MTHTFANGRADHVGAPIELGEFLPEKRVVVLNGRRYEAWVTTNRRYPRRLQAQLDRYRARYEAAIEPLTQLALLTDEERAAADVQARRQRALERVDEAYQQFVTDALMTLVENLDESVAELIAQDQAESLLRELGYFAPLQEDSVQDAGSGGGGSDGGETSEGSSDASPLIGDSASRDSPASSLGTTSSDS